MASARNIFAIKQLINKVGHLFRIDAQTRRASIAPLYARIAPFKYSVNSAGESASLARRARDAAVVKL